MIYVQHQDNGRYSITFPSGKVERDLTLQEIKEKIEDAEDGE